jgi:hypothetical protein
MFKQILKTNILKLNKICILAKQLRKTKQTKNNGGTGKGYSGSRIYQPPAQNRKRDGTPSYKKSGIGDFA